jgi:hypothetical protein
MHRNYFLRFPVDAEKTSCIFNHVYWTEVGLIEVLLKLLGAGMQSLDRNLTYFLRKSKSFWGIWGTLPYGSLPTAGQVQPFC